ncbi:MAG: amidohydrolase [Candidatus Cloacimonetes bacterium]|nr:amidohydrolase [Candidatus Cloacimonadota bacterium]
MQLFLNADFYSMEYPGAVFKAVLVENGIILETYREIPLLNDVEKIDLNRACVYPGFSDTHTHSFQGGLYSLGADLGRVSSIEDVLDTIRETTPVEDKVFAYNFDENLIPEKRFPTMLELNKIHPGKKIFLRRIDGHSCVINSLAADTIEWSAKLPSNFNGLLREKFNDEAAHWFHQLGQEGILKAYQKAAEIAIKGGFTTIHTMIGDAEDDLEHFDFIKGKLDHFPIDFILYPQMFNIRKAINIGSARIGGCILADGSFGSHTAGLKQSYADEPGNFGTLYQSNEFWNDFVEDAHDNNLQVCVHAIGDAAIEQILTAVEKAQRKCPKDLRHQIIHNELTSDNMIKRMSVANVSAVMQPMFDRLWGGSDGFYSKVLGKERALQTNKFSTIYKSGVLLTGSSDWYITELDVIKGIHAATVIHNKSERLTPFEAVTIYTKNAEKVAFREKTHGLIKKGYTADFTYCNSNIFTEEDIGKVKILGIVKNGKMIKNG